MTPGWPHPLFAAAFDPDALAADEKLALSVFAGAVALFAFAAAYHGSAAALPIPRWLFRRSGEALVLVAVYAIVRTWS
ncbi:MAG: hypothetical protein IT304_11585 [Dehalococcoidia bacterium]|nr:hypothetical protein [Dehalococcoidia bacterium]